MDYVYPRKAAYTCSTGPDTADPISYLAMDGDAVWAAAGTSIIKYVRGKEVSRAKGSVLSISLFLRSFEYQVHWSLPYRTLRFLELLYLHWTIEENECLYGIPRMEVIHQFSDICFAKYPSLALQATVQFDADFTATSILHPSTYLNKVLVSSSQGSMQLWNIRSQ